LIHSSHNPLQPFKFQFQNLLVPPRKKNRTSRYYCDRSSLNRRESPPKPTSRRYQRWLNDNSILDSVDIEDEIDYPLYEWLPSPFQKLAAREDLWSLWTSSFLETTDDLQEEILAQMFKFEERAEANDQEEELPPSAHKRFQRLDRDYKGVLRQFRGSKFLTDLDQELFNFSLTSDHNYPLPLIFGNSCERLACHAACHYYSLYSRSTFINGSRVTIVRKHKHHPPSPSMSLSAYLEIPN